MAPETLIRYPFSRWGSASVETRHHVLMEARSLLLYRVATEMPNVVGSPARDALLALQALIKQDQDENPELLDLVHLA